MSLRNRWSASKVFGRAPGYDTKLDSVVRTEAAKLCARLTEYYASEGAADPLVIVVPKGGKYRSYDWQRRFRQRARPARGAPRHAQEVVFLAPLVFAGLAVILAAVGWMRFRVMPADLRSGTYSGNAIR